MITIAHQVIWTKAVLDEFCELANLTPFQREVMTTRLTMTRLEQCRYFNISTATLDRTIAVLKRLYDEVQPQSKILKPRVFSAQELYQDRN